MGPAHTARFDDLRPGHLHAWELVDPVGVVVAEHHDDVVAALGEVEAATEAGLWAAGWVAYEAGAALDPALPRRDATVPLVCFGLYRNRRRVPSLLAGAAPAASAAAGGAQPRLRSAMGEAAHHAAVLEVHRRITAGDVYQVNLTTMLTGPAPDDVVGLARALGAAQRGAWHALVDAGDVVVVAASPELFLARTGELVLSRPMKGTSRRGRWPEDDAARADALLASPKERAELVMIVDLVRNDLGRVARVGSVRADRAPRLEGYPTVWQLTGRVAARLRPDVGLVELLAATFPPGSVTGAPKVTATRAIAELEVGPRDVYCGLVGWLGPGRRARFAVAIRTAVLDRRTGAPTLRYGAGGGITIDAQPAPEWRELQAKAAVLGAPVPSGLLETFASRPRRGAVRLARHLDRMQAAAHRWCFDFDRAAVQACVQRAVQGRTTPGRVRVLLHPDGRVDVRVEGLVATPVPVRLAVDPEPLDTADPRRSSKVADRDELARRLARQPGADDVVLLGPGGEVVEATTANLLVRVGGRWCTPPLSAGCLPGIGRGVLVRAGRVHERALHVADLDAAEALAVVSSLRGIRPATLVRG